MNLRPVHVMAMVLAAAMPLAAWSAEPVENKARQLYLDFAQAPATGPDDSLQASVDRLKAQSVQRAAAPATSQATAIAPAEPIASQPARDILSSEMIETLKRIPAGQQQNLLSVADALFIGNRSAQAAAVYEALMAQNPPPPTRSWVLYQLANCRRATDSSGAMVLYLRVVKEHPDCPWAQAAEATAKLLEWKQASAVQELLESSRQVSLELTAPPASRPAVSKPSQEGAPAEQGHADE